LEEVTTEREEYHGDFDCHIIIKMKEPIGDFVRNSSDVDDIENSSIFKF
jgi:hypothetical protein